MPPRRVLKTSQPLNVVPAYGRDYTTARAALADWHAGKDFRIFDISSADDGRYVSVTDAPGPVRIRFDKLRKFVIVPE